MTEKLNKILKSKNTDKDKSLMIILMLEYDMNMSLHGNGHLDGDDVFNTLEQDEKKFKKLVEKMYKLIEKK